jgi:hypothetical protein
MMINHDKPLPKPVTSRSLGFGLPKPPVPQAAFLQFFTVSDGSAVAVVLLVNHSLLSTIPFFLVHITHPEKPPKLEVETI